jgi:hypothetical protein
VKQFLLKTGISAGLLLVFVFAYGSFCDFFFTQNENLDLTEKKSWVLAQENGVYDYAILGSSRAFGAVDMNLLDSLTGLNGINIASNGSGFKDNFLVLHLFLRTNAIKKLFLQVDMGSLNSKSSFSNEFHAFTFMPFWEQMEVQEVLKEEIPLLDNPISDMAPQWRYFYFNKYFSPKEVLRRVSLSNPKEDSFTKSKGGIGNGVGTQGKAEIKTYELPKSADPEDWNYLMKITSMAEAAGIEVLFFTAPRYRDSQVDVKKILSSIPVKKVFFDQFDILDVENFIDQGHLTRSGTIKLTKAFSGHFLVQDN